MLWHKAWLETRWRFVFCLGFVIVIQAFIHWSGAKARPAQAHPLQAASAFALLSIGWVTTMLSGSGIQTQPSFQATRGLHASTYFTLSLPVSRSRLLLVRAALGWFEEIVVIALLSGGLWIFYPMLRTAARGSDMLAYTLVLFAFASALYSTSVLLGTLLEDIWRMWGSILLFVGLWMICNLASVPQSLNIFRALTSESPLIVHSISWPAVGIAAGLTFLLTWTATIVVRIREY